MSEVIFSQESCSDQIDIVHQTFRRGGSTLKALEQTHLFAEGLVMRLVESEEDGSVQELLDLDDE